MRIVFMGSPDFAVPSLQILVENGYEIVGVITATDKMGGRGGKKLLETAVKKYAVEQGLRVLQPKNLKAPEFVEELRSLNADLQIVVAFRMLPEVVWNMPPIGTFNLHGSLLPKYRGAAPINWAIINGEKETGVTTFFLKHEIDTGDIILQEKLPIGPDETFGEIYTELKELGAEVVLKTVRMVEAGDYVLQSQEEKEVSKAPKIFHDDCQINFHQSAQNVHNFIRGLSPFPTAWTLLDDQKLKIFRTTPIQEEHSLQPGAIRTDGKKWLRIATEDGWVELRDLQLAGRKRMDSRSFINGYQFGKQYIVGKL
jgi:methionyl-tRNA formyltransferase